MPIRYAHPGASMYRWNTSARSPQEENQMPMPSIEEQLSTAQACHDFYPADPWLALCVRHLKHIVELKAQLAALQWTPISPENLPKAGDEVLGYEDGLFPVYPVSCIPDHERSAEDWHKHGWTHFRPIAPPEPSGVQAEEFDGE